MDGWRRKRRNVRRLVKITQVAVKHGFGYMLEHYNLKSFLPWRMRKKVFTSPEEEKAEAFAHNLMLMLQELGPTFIKIGQFLSIRPDLVPPEVVFELEKLQDEVASFDFSLARKVIKEELGKEVEEAFKSFEEIPFAAASIGQVHMATLDDDSEVVVKVQRPGAQEMIEADIDLLFMLAERVKDRVQWIDLVGVIQEFSDSLHRELDYRVEGRHADRFRYNFRDDTQIATPVVFWKYTTRRVLTLEYIEGTKLSDLATPQMQGIDTYALAEHGAVAVMKQVLVDGFFHGDLHPANLLITPDGKIGYLDFGIVGQISEKDRRTITYMLVAIVKQDIEEIVRQAQNLGITIPPEKVYAMKDEFKDILARYYGKSLKEMQIDIIGREFLSLIYRHHLYIPKDFALLAKALITVEGVAKHLYPEFNIIDVAKPYALDLIKKEYPREQAIEDIYEQIKEYALYILSLPGQIHDVLDQARSGELKIKYQYSGLEKPSERFERATNRLSITLVLTAILLGTLLVFIFKLRISFMVTWFVLALFILAWLAFSIFRSSR